jgi:hypothetical protein
MKEIEPLKFLKAVYMNADLPLSVRMRAAIELLPFTHPKLAVTALVNEQDFATLLDRRLKRIEAMNGKPQTIDQTIEAKPPLPRVADRRFRRF